METNYIIEFKNTTSIVVSLLDTITGVKTLIRDHKVMPDKVKELDNERYQDFDYNKVRNSLRIRKQVWIKMRDGSVMKIYEVRANFSPRGPVAVIGE